MKVIRKYVPGVLLTCMLFVMAGISVQASEEQFKAGTVWAVTNDTEVKETANDAARTVGEIEAGTAVLLVEDAADGWCKVQNQSLIGYIPVEDIQKYQAGNEEELKKEFVEQEQMSITGIEEYEQTMKEKRTATIWGIIIGVLVAAIFAVGIILVLKGDKEQAKESESGAEEMYIEEIGEDDQ